MEDQTQELDEKGVSHQAPTAYMSSLFLSQADTLVPPVCVEQWFLIYSYISALHMKSDNALCIYRCFLAQVSSRDFSCCASCNHVFQFHGAQVGRSSG